MLVNAVVNPDDHSRQPQKKKVRIPLGSWAVVLNDQQEHPNEPGEYIWQDESFRFNFITEREPNTWAHQNQPNEVVLRETSYDGKGPVDADENGYHGSEGTYLVTRRVLFWSEKPFAVVRNDGDPWDNVKVFLAQEITEHGLGRLPDFPLPDFVKSMAGKWGKLKRPGKWTRLTQVAELCELTPQQVLKLHMWNHFRGYMEDGVLFLRSQDDLGVVQAEKCQRVKGSIEQKEFLEGPLEDVWVTKHFALVVLYMHMVGYHRDHPDLKEKKTA